MRNPHYGKWLSDDDPADQINLKESPGMSSCRLLSSDVETIEILEAEKARLKNLLKRRGLSKRQNFESFIFGDFPADRDKVFENIISLKVVEELIRELNFKIKVIKGKARI